MGAYFTGTNLNHGDIIGKSGTMQTGNDKSGNPDHVVVVPTQPQPQSMQIDRQTTETPWNWCLLLSSFISIFFCQCLGLVATIAAVVAYVDHRVKDFAGAKSKTSLAWGFAIAAFVIGVLCFLMCIVVMVTIIQNAEHFITMANDAGFIETMQNHRDNFIDKVGY